MNARTARPTRAVRDGLVTNALTVLVTVSVMTPWQAPAPAAGRGTVVESQCIDGRITESIDDGNPAGLLAYDTGEPC